MADPLTSSSRPIHHFLNHKLHVADSQLDGGVPTRNWFDDRAPSLAQGTPDNRVSVSEIYRASFERLEQLSLGRPDFKQELCPSTKKPDFFCFFKDHSPNLPPWLIDDGNDNTPADAEVREWIDQKIAAETKKLTDQGMQPHTLLFNQKLLNPILISLQQPRETGGMGLIYNPNRLEKKRDAVQTFQEHEGDCNSFSFLFFAMAYRAGLNPTFIRVASHQNNKNRKAEEMFHIAVGVHLDPDHPEMLTPADPSLGAVLNNTYEWYPLTSLEMEAIHLKNWAWKNIPSNLSNRQKQRWQETLLLQAEALAPNDLEIELELTRFYQDVVQDEAKTQAHFQQAQAIRPSLNVIWEKP